MQQPGKPGKPMSTLPGQEKTKAPPQQKKKTKMSSPQELVSHYESQGLDSTQASLKAIDDLQKLLLRVVSSRGPKNDKIPPDAARKLDALNARLAVLETKVDSKPGYPGAFAIGVASGAALSGMGTLLSSLSQIWSSVANPPQQQ
ncbi:hypothetical protein BT93_K1596 [Corymbia citriodora subsp. variegata]|nr:hypothetical protein BT93_K1596 [Corymbia citriodora subsp. variegata]